ncbi:uncharacterized protein IWZ02DRAFT_115169 [Phyllosticta citriasiana]|uniref:uncharacterized protein n=1 Tax=Phyllosticta citriasiana TaxID=595635 RepID=UPI0030FD9E48
MEMCTLSHRYLFSAHSRLCKCAPVVVVFLLLPLLFSFQPFSSSSKWTCLLHPICSTLRTRVSSIPLKNGRDRQIAMRNNAALNIPSQVCFGTASDSLDACNFARVCASGTAKDQRAQCRPRGIASLHHYDLFCDFSRRHLERLCIRVMEA